MATMSQFNRLRHSSKSGVYGFDPVPLDVMAYHPHKRASPASVFPANSGQGHCHPAYRVLLWRVPFQKRSSKHTAGNSGPALERSVTADAGCGALGSAGKAVSRWEGAGS